MTVKERVDRHDRQIEAIRKLVHEGMKMLVETRQLVLETRGDLRQVVAIQKPTEEKLELRGSNGHIQ